MTVRFYIIAADTEKELSGPTFAKGMPIGCELFMHVMTLDQLKNSDDELFVAELIEDGNDIAAKAGPVHRPDVPDLPFDDDPDWRSKM